MRFRTCLWLTATLLSSAAACGDDAPAGDDVDPDAEIEPPDAEPPQPKPVLLRPSKSSTVAISDDDATVVMVNTEDDSVSIFRTSDNTRIAIVPTGDEPSSVVIAPDNTTAYVSNRGDATVVKIENIDSGSAAVTATTPVGSEPAGLALTPTGEHLFVAEYAEGTVSRIDTATMAEPTSADLITAPAYPRALIVTNDGDEDETDEVLIVPEFFGELATDGSAADAALLDKSRTGRVRIYNVGTLAPETPITLAPLDSGATPVGTGSAQFTSPNQLWSVSLRRDPAALDDSSRGTLYLTSISTSPQAPARHNGNIYPVVYVGDLSSRAEVTGASGTVNLSKLLFNASPNPGAFTGKTFLADLVDMSFLPSSTGESTFAYAVSRGADVVQRIEFGSASTAVGSATNLQIDLIGTATDVTDGCKGPTGIVVANSGANAYVNCWVSRRLGVVALGNTQALTIAVEAVNPPSDTGAFPTALDLTKGRRFFFTGRGRWSGDGTATVEPTQNGLAFSACASCHPDGLTDNVTWIFAAGPRQSTSMDGSFSHPASGAQEQRVFNWTGIIDEMHDFERNTRGVSGGKGAVTSAGSGTCGNVATEARKAVSGELSVPVKEVQDDTTVASCVKDWDEIEAWSKTIRPPRALQRLDATKVAAGAAIFGGTSGATDEAGCASCHGGAGWTVSKRFYDPSTAQNAALLTDAFAGGSPWPASWNEHTTQRQNEMPGGTVGPEEISCVIRRLTFGTNSDTFGVAALEKKPDGTSVAAGAGGYNVPSLYGLALGAPYLHHGQAYALGGARASLDALFTTAAWQDHYRAGNQNFDVSDATLRDELIEFLLSIDASTTEIAIPANFDKCP